jgi:hypothetical protein
MPDWIKQKQKNWPTGAKARALNGKTAIEALEEELRKRAPVPPENIVTLLEILNDEDLAIATSARIIKCMHLGGVRRAEGKRDSE